MSFPFGSCRVWNKSMFTVCTGRSGKMPRVLNIGDLYDITGLPSLDMDRWTPTETSKNFPIFLKSADSCRF